jgi:hypothetical protein
MPRKKPVPLRARVEALDRQKATSDILQVIKKVEGTGLGL